MEFDYLVDHARRQVWCTPNQDSQGIFKLTRLTPSKGVSVYTDVMWRRLYLPEYVSTPVTPGPMPYNTNNDTKWHVFQVGQVNPSILALVPATDQWKSFASAMTEGKLIADIYTVDGICLPRFESYYMFNPDHDLIVAVKDNSAINFSFENDDIYLRLYANEYFHSLRSNQVDDRVWCEGRKLYDMSDYNDIKNSYDSYLALPGNVTAYVNGHIVSDISPGTVNMPLPQTGPVTTVEFVYDSSVYRTYEFKIRDLPVFHSELDSKLKYLLHYNNPQNTSVIDYQDDVDVYIFRKTGTITIGTVVTEIRKGVYYHRNTKDAVRSLTHRDYSIPVQYTDSLNIKLQELVSSLAFDPQELYVKLYIRKSGYERPLVFEDNRIHELYKIAMTPTNDGVKNAMVDIDSVMPYWRAPFLEKAKYPLIMRSECCDIDNQMVTDAYGYNAISTLIGDTPNNVIDVSGVKVARVPYGLQNGTGVYEYDNNGVLIGGVSYLQSGDTYLTNSILTENVEMLSGRPSITLDEYVLYELGIANPITLPTNTSYRVYNCSHVGGVPISSTLVDVTGSALYVVNANNELSWVGSSPSDYPIVRTDRRFLAYNVNLPTSNGLLSVTLAHNQRFQGSVVSRPMIIPMAQLDVFLNGRPLIEGLDYIMQFPRILIINKEYLINPNQIGSTQRIDVRYSGLCKSDFTSEKNNDYGFIEYGVLSNNSRFDIRDDKVLRIMVDGHLKTRSDLVFSEMHSGVSVINAINGKPYAIRDIIVPVKGLATGDTYALRAHSQVIDKAASDYLTSKIPQPPRTGPNGITARYQVFSPFFNKLIYDFSNGVISPVSQPLFYGPYTDQDLINFCYQNYEWLLKYDPISEVNNLPDQYVIIHPHNLFTTISLDAYAHKFLRKAVAIYGRGLINLSPHLTVTPTPP